MIQKLVDYLNLLFRNWKRYKAGSKSRKFYRNRAWSIIDYVSWAKIITREQQTHLLIWTDNWHLMTEITKEWLDEQALHVD